MRKQADTCLSYSKARYLGRVTSRITCGRGRREGGRRAAPAQRGGVGVGGGWEFMQPLRHSAAHHSCRRQQRGRGNTKQGRGGGGRHPTDRLTAASTKKIECDVPIFALGSAPANIRREHVLQQCHSAPHACPTIYSSKLGSFEINISISLAAEYGDAMLLHVVSRTNG
jgi:hypothetical protein